LLGEIATWASCGARRLDVSCWREIGLVDSEKSDDCSDCRALSAVVGSDTEVPVLNGSRARYVHLDNAATTPCLRIVHDRVNEFLCWYSSIHRGTGYKSILSTEAYERARETVGRFVGADPNEDVVIFVRNTTDALNKLARRFPFDEGDVVLASTMEHHSNLLPWRALADVDHVAVRPDGDLDLEDLRRKLAAYDGRVKMVAVAAGSNVTGLLNPIHEIAKLAHEAGAMVAVDAAQLAAHRPIEMEHYDSPDHLDFVALSDHKMYSPFGVGALVGRRRVFERGVPDRVGGGTVAFVTLDEVSWSQAPSRDEAGTPNVVGAVALATACQTLEQIGLRTIAAHEAELTRYLLEKMREVPGLKVFGLSDPARAAERLGVVSFSLEGVPHGLVASILSYEGGIGVRNGCFCAHPYLLRLLHVPQDRASYVRERISAGDRSEVPGLVRASVGLQNTKEDLDRLVEALRVIARGEYEGEYVLDPNSGLYSPRGFDLEVTSHFSL
jgi:cysteine desulfurase/selenocysteine lyase